MIIAAALLGLVIGSFISCLSWRLPRKISFTRGRSFCPKCRHVLSWHDNIPIFSYLLLGGQCRSCGKKISLRYPTLELVTSLIFVLLVWVMTKGGDSIIFSKYQSWINDFSLIYFLALFGIFVAITVIDLEHMIIPDSLVGIGVVLSFVVLLFAPSPVVFEHLFWATLGALAPLVLNILTRGLGMGLGDVKLGFLLGLVVGKLIPLVFFVAVFSGAVIGISLVIGGRAKMRSPIPFGPFLIFGGFVIILFGESINKLVGL